MKHLILLLFMIGLAQQLSFNLNKKTVSKVINCETTIINNEYIEHSCK